MKANKLIFLIAVLNVSIVSAGTVHNTMISIAEQKMLGHMFKHVMTSGGAEKDEFFIDGYAVSKENYYKEFERVQKKEREEELAAQEAVRRSRLQFSDMMQVEIAAKLLHKLMLQVNDLVKKIVNPSLQKFYIFSDMTIESVEQLNQLRHFLDQLQPSIQKRIENLDFQGLTILHAKLEPWPARLEKFFQDTIQQAITQSDDTAMLKELLKLVSDSFPVS